MGTVYGCQRWQSAAGLAGSAATPRLRARRLCTHPSPTWAARWAPGRPCPTAGPRKPANGQPAAQPHGGRGPHRGSCPRPAPPRVRGWPRGRGLEPQCRGQGGGACAVTRPRGPLTLDPWNVHSFNGAASASGAESRPRGACALGDGGARGRGPAPTSRARRADLSRAAGTLARQGGSRAEGKTRCLRGPNRAALPLPLPPGKAPGNGGRTRSYACEHTPSS